MTTLCCADLSDGGDSLQHHLDMVAVENNRFAAYVDRILPQCRKDLLADESLWHQYMALASAGYTEQEYAVQDEAAKLAARSLYMQSGRLMARVIKRSLDLAVDTLAHARAEEHFAALNRRDDMA